MLTELTDWVAASTDEDDVITLLHVGDAEIVIPDVFGEILLMVGGQMFAETDYFHRICCCCNLIELNF